MTTKTKINDHNLFREDFGDKIELSEMGPFEQITYYFYQRYQLEFLVKFSLHEIQIFQIKNKSLKA